MLTILFILIFPVSATALLLTRREYRKRGKLSLLGLLLVCAMLILPNLLIHYSMSYKIPTSLLEFVGVGIALLGLGLCLLSVTIFRSALKVLCVDAGSLPITGPYRWSRNPQYLGWMIFLTGFCLTDWSWWCLAALVAVAVSLHLLVLVEEEHLHRTFGEPYAAYCRKVPRYFGWKN